MKGGFFLLVILTAIASLVSCGTAKQSTAGSASIVGMNWQLVELNGKTVLPSEPLKKAPHMILNAADKRVTGNGGCNSFFGSYELPGGNGIAFSKMGATLMACPDSVMQIEHQLFQAFEMTNTFTVRNDTLWLTKADLSPLAKFVVGDPR